MLVLALFVAAVSDVAPGVTADVSRCENDSRVLNQEARNGTLWAQRMLDSWGQLPVSGFLEGNVALLGNFDECLDVGGKYCLATVRLPQASVGEISDDSAPTDDHLVVQRQVLATTPGHPLRWAVCVPPVCGPAQVAALLRQRLASLLPAAQADAAAVDVRDDLCSVATASPLQPREWAFIVVMGLVAILLVASTVYEVAMSNRNQLQQGGVWAALSLRRNWTSLTAVSSSGFGCLHGLKFLSMVWILLHHVFNVSDATPAINWDRTVPTMVSDWTRMPLGNAGTLAVDVFFLISGLLVASNFLRDRAGGQPFCLFRFYLRRYLRLTPPVAVLIWFYATVLPRLGSGPLWPELVESESDRCARLWWTNLLYVNNYWIFDEQCLGHTWYLAADTQLLWCSPPLLWALWRCRRAGPTLLLAAVLAASAAVFAVTFCYRLPWADSLGLTHEKWADYMLLMNQTTYSRIVPYVVGMGLGWLLFSNKDKTCRMNVVAVFAGWSASTALALLSVFGLHLSYLRPYRRLEAALFASLRPLAWALAIAWVIYACEKGRAGPVNTFLSWRGFQPLAKLSYCAYLVQCGILLYEIGETRTPITFGRYYLIQRTLAVLLLVLAVAAVLSLAFEMPAMYLSKALLDPVAGSQHGNGRFRDKRGTEASKRNLSAELEVNHVQMTVESPREQ